MKNFLARIRYPKFLLLLVSYVVAYLLFGGATFISFREKLLEMGYFGSFFAGLLYVYGFTAAFGTGILLTLAKGQNIFLAGCIGGLGALLGDLLIFKFVRHSFADEINRLKREKVIVALHNKMPLSVRKYFVPVLGGLLVATPLPDELGVSLLAVSSVVSTRLFFVVSYILNTGGIFVVLMVGAFA